MDERKAVYVGNNRVLITTIFGQRMYVDGRDLSLAPHLIVDGFWEMWVTKRLKEILRPGMTFVDVGAHVGYYTLLAAQAVGPQGHVVAVEAHPDTFDLLRTNVEVNGLSWATVHRGAAWYRGGEQLILHALDRHTGSSSLCEDPAIAGDSKHEHEVGSLALDDIVTSAHVVKIDAEGSEAHVLAGASRLLDSNPIVIMECTHSNVGAAEALVLAGFSLRGIPTSDEDWDVARDLDDLRALPPGDVSMIEFRRSALTD